MLGVIVGAVSEGDKSLRRPAIQKILYMIKKGEVKAIIIAKLDRLTRSAKDLCGLLDLFEKKGVALIFVAESLIPLPLPADS